MAQFIKRLQGKGIHNRLDIDLLLQDGVNIVYGRNGTGKTTVLHILANAVNGDFERFVYLSFHEIDVGLDDSTTIHVEQAQLEKPDLVKVSAWIDGSPVVKFTLGELLERERLESRRRSERIETADTDSVFKTGLHATYFPAFRTMIEAWGSASERDYRMVSPSYGVAIRNQPFKATGFARSLFGKFVPAVSFPSLLEVEEQLNLEIREALFRVAKSDEALLTNALVEAFAATSQESTASAMIDEEPEKTLESISKVIDRLQESPLQSKSNPAENIYTRLKKQLASIKLGTEEGNIARRILAVYKGSLQKRLDEQTRAFLGIETYLESVNQFLEGKKLVVEHRDPKRGLPQLGVKFDDGHVVSLQTLSSGERQIVSLIYAATHMESSGIVLIDEPEISLHIDWQRELMPALIKQLPAKQVIVCTHSAIIGAEYEERMTELVPARASSHEILGEANASYLDDIAEDEAEDPFGEEIPF